MNSDIQKKILSTMLLISMTIGLLIFSDYKRPVVSRTITGTMQVASLKAKAVTVPKADLLGDVLTELLKFIKKL